jgi:nicotinamide-nucleotide amidase
MRLLLAGYLCTAGIVLPVAGADVNVDPDSTGQPTQYSIIVTGGELLAGAYADSHTQLLTATLHPLGLRCVGSISVDDKPADIIEALRFARQKAPLVLVTGGLGPTDNDLTRETLAEFTGIPLREHPDVLQAMEQRLGTPRDALRANLRRQTRVPSRGSYLGNRNGTAVGLVFELDDATIVALPGPPRELQPMVREQLVPYLIRRYGVRSPGCSLTLRFVGLGQSLVDQTLEDHVTLPANVTLSSGFEAGRVDFTFSLAGDTPEDRARLQQLKEDVLRHLGQYVYAEDAETSLEQRVLRLLGARGEMLAIVDSGTGGVLAAGLAGCGSDAGALAGCLLASTEDGLRRMIAVDHDRWSACTTEVQRVELLAETAADCAGSRCAIAVGQPRRDANGGSYVEAAFRLPNGVGRTAQLHLRGTSPSDRSRLATELLDRLRRLLVD